MGKLDDAEYWYRHAANVGHPGAIARLGELIYKKYGIAAAKAVWLQLEDELDRQSAYDIKHAAYDIRALLHVKGNLHDAITWYEIAADAGHSAAMDRLGDVVNQIGPSRLAEEITDEIRLLRMFWVAGIE